MSYMKADYIRLTYKVKKIGVKMKKKLEIYGNLVGKPNMAATKK